MSNRYFFTFLRKIRMKKFYITTAIAYPNAKPHMWHALEIVQADALARIHRILWKHVVFQTWTDEHGIKNRRTAQQQGKDVLTFLDENVATYKDLYAKLLVTYDTFLRTSDTKIHYPWAQKLWTKLVEAWDIYKKKYIGLYCAWCESFKTEKELIDGKCPDHMNGQIEEIQEENYFFALSKYKDEVKTLITNDSYRITPETRKNEILSFLDNANDVSFSRPKSSLPRGIPIPGDEEHVMYVWCDALSNYITGQWYANDQEKFNETWPADIHLIGKDILRFHAAFWPAMLLSAQLALPKQLIVHGHVTLNGQKMSKSTGNVIDPMDILDSYDRDAFAFQLLYDISIATDGDFSLERLGNLYESMLIGGRGNLVNRVTSLCKKYGITSGKFNKQKREVFKENSNSKLLHFFEDGRDGNQIEEMYLKEADIKWYLDDWYQLVQRANEYITTAEPWIKYKNDETKAEALSDLQFLLYIVKNIALFSAPILVNGFKKIQEIFGNEELSTIDSAVNNADTTFKEVFDSEDFPVNLNPVIIYKKKEE